MLCGREKGVWKGVWKGVCGPTQPWQCPVCQPSLLLPVDDQIKSYQPSFHLHKIRCKRVGLPSFHGAYERLHGLHGRFVHGSGAQPGGKRDLNWTILKVYLAFRDQARITIFSEPGRFRMELASLWLSSVPSHPIGHPAIPLSHASRLFHNTSLAWHVTAGGDRSRGPIMPLPGDSPRTRLNPISI